MPNLFTAASAANEVSMLTHDNGSRPFLVVHRQPNDDCRMHHVFVYRRPGDGEKDSGSGQEHAHGRYSRLVLVASAFKVFTAGFHGFSGVNAQGNTVLARMTPADSPQHRYLWVGERIVEYDLPEPITAYLSKIGNSDVPYPLGLSASYVWFFTTSYACGTRPASRSTPVGVPRTLLRGYGLATETLATVDDLAANEGRLYDWFWAKPNPLQTHPEAVLATNHVTICRRPGWEEIEDRQDAYVPGQSSDEE